MTRRSKASMDEHTDDKDLQNGFCSKFLIRSSFFPNQEPLLQVWISKIHW